MGQRYGTSAWIVSSSAILSRALAARLDNSATPMVGCPNTSKLLRFCTKLWLGYRLGSSALLSRASAARPSELQQLGAPEKSLRNLALLSRATTARRS